MHEAAPTKTLSQAMLQLLRGMGYQSNQIALQLKMQASEVSRVAKGEREFKAHHLVAIQNYVQIPLAILIATSMKFIDGREMLEEAVRTSFDEFTKEMERFIDQRSMENLRKKHNAA